MKFENSISILFRSLGLLAILILSGCATGGTVTNARACVEIPFLDAPEGACVWTVSQKRELINAEEWKKQRPYMIMIDADSWTDIKKDWLKACRIAGPDCNVAVDSIDTMIKKLDAIVGQMMPKP